MIKKLHLFTLILVTLNLFGNNFFHESVVTQGHPLTLIISPVTQSTKYTFTLINSKGKDILELKGFYYYLEEIETPIVLGLAGIPSNLPPGNYQLIASGEATTGNYLFKREITVIDGEYPTTTLQGNSKMDNIVNGEITQERKDQSKRLWEAISSFTPHSHYHQGKLTQPVEGRHSSPFGFLRVTKYPKGKTTTSVHKGEDYANKIGTPVYSDARGLVLLAENRIVTGNTVVVEHLPGVKTLYYHLNSISVKPGDIVLQGEKIGEVGTTGFSTGPHLHWELRISTVPVDPKLFIDVPLIDKKHIMNIIDSTNNKKGG